MKVSLNWLRDYVTWDESPAELADGLTSLGLNVEGIEEFRLTFPGVVVAKVIECGKHPDADRLSLCRVDDGETVHQVVCGAPNVREGLTVLLAKVGAVLPGDFKLKKSKIRGVESQGMICSATELELGADGSGIMELSDEFEVGTPADEIYGYEDTVFDIEVTPNRPDWLSHIGVAREIAAFNGSKVVMPEHWTEQSNRLGGFDFNVEIEDFADCPRYTACGVKEMKTGPSPRFMQMRLRAIGERPINNVVDITNYVLFEIGQPMHAFDRDKLTGARLIVRRAEKGQPFTTLDGVKRTLGDGDLIIADNAGPVGLGGVMGGQNTQVDENTTEIVLESAFFAPGLVRTASRRLGLLSEASYRFERGADWEMVEWASSRALYLFHKHGGGKPAGDCIDRRNPDRSAPLDIALRTSQVNRVLGTELETADVVTLLQRLGMKVTPLGAASDRKSGAGSLMAKIPPYRRDLLAEIDLIEEVGRLFGVDNIPAGGGRRGNGAAARPLREKRIGLMRRHLASVGYFEAVTSTFFGREDLDRLGVANDDPRRQCLSVLNPQHGGEILLRTSLLPSLLRCVERNINADNGLPLRLFHTGKVFLPRQEAMADPRHGEEKLLPEEHELLQVAIAGRKDTGIGDIPADLLEVKALLGDLIETLALDVELRVLEEEHCLTAGRRMALVDAEGRKTGVLGAVNSDVLTAYGIDVAVVIAELDLGILSTEARAVRYRPFSRYPAIKRDLSLIVPNAVSSEAVIAGIEKYAGPLLKSVELFDIYRGKELPENTAAVGIRLKFASDKGNLKSKAVDKSISKVRKGLESDLGIVLRG